MVASTTLAALAIIGANLIRKPQKESVMKFEDIYIAMKRYNGHVAYGSECNAWQDFVEDCYKTLGHAPWNDERWNDEVSECFGPYWLEVANGESPYYNAKTGARRDDLGC